MTQAMLLLLHNRWGINKLYYVIGIGLTASAGRRDVVSIRHSTLWSHSCVFRALIRFTRDHTRGS